MPIKKRSNTTKQTPEEFAGSFKDWLDYYVRENFKEDDRLLFITHQPDTIILEPDKIRKQTKQLLKEIRYVEVIEQTFKVNKRYNYANFIGGYHSHLIVKEDEYVKIEERLKGLDIDKQVVYDLEGLKKYLSKQAGISIWELPTNHIPLPIVEAIKKVIAPVGNAIDETINIVVETINKVIKPTKSKAMVWIDSIISKYILPDWNLDLTSHILRLVVDDT